MLSEAGHETIHVREVDLLAASDEAIFAYALERNLVVVTSDSDFAAMLALRGSSGPSVVQLRGVAELQPAAHLALLVENLPEIRDDLEAGAVVSLSPNRLAVRRLPIR